MEVFDSVSGIRAWSSMHRRGGGTVGLVPTMGCLHDGHAHLLDRARGENDFVVLSVFVNPLQFREDAYRVYPRRIEADLLVAQECGVDAVFAPSVEEMYPHCDSVECLFGLQDGRSGPRDGEAFRVDRVGEDGSMEYVRVPERLVMRMDGKDHPWHFDGVATVVRRLFEIVGPSRAYFGQKDIQQVAILGGLNAWMGGGVELVEVPVVRDADGVSSSSRLVMLDAQQRGIASGVAGLVARFASGGSGARVDELIEGFEGAVDEMELHGNTLEIDSIECVDPVTLEPLEVLAKDSVVYVAYLINGIRLAETARC